MNVKRFRSLFFKAVFVLTIISLVPVVLIGYHVLRVNSRMLEREILQHQQNVTRRLASTISAFMDRSSQLFAVFTDLHTDFGGHDFLDKQDLKYLRAKDPSIIYLAALNLQGQQVVTDGTPSAFAPYKTEIPQMLESCVKRGEAFMGQVYVNAREERGMLMGFPVRAKVGSPEVSGVLLAEVTLTPLQKALAQAYPLEMEALVIDENGLLISYNGWPTSKDGSIPEDLKVQLQQIQDQLNGASNGDILLAGGQKLLATSTPIPSLNWRIYVFQPANVVSQLFKKSTYQSGWDILLVLGAILFFLVVVSYVVIIPITRPVERLRTAALKLRELDDYVIKPQEVDVPHNELGDLAEAMIELSQVLHTRRQALLEAQHQLLSTNEDLEKRVEERTRELKETSRELVRAERLASIGQMASIISHEIRNPLAVISNASRLIKLLVPADSPKVMKQLNIIEAEIKQANSIISEVLGYARTRELMFSMIDVSSYLRDILNVYSFPPNIKLVEELTEDSVRIKVDAEEIKQAIRNVISNAVDAMQPGGGTLRVGMKTGRRLVCIYIADTGPGISPEVRKKMFAPFFTTKARGTGLGLAVVGKAISRHNGKLLISSEEGKGTCFQIYLKIYKKTGDTNYGEAS